MIKLYDILRLISIKKITDKSKCYDCNVRLCCSTNSKYANFLQTNDFIRKKLIK